MNTQNPIVVTAVFSPKENARDELVKRLKSAIAEVHAEPGCLLYALHGASDAVVLIEKWSSEQLLDAHGAGAAVRRLDASIVDLIERPAVVTRMHPIVTGREAQGAL